MTLDKEIMEQLATVFANLKSQFNIVAYIDRDTDRGRSLDTFLHDFASTTPLISLEVMDRVDSAEFKLQRGGRDLGVTFRGVPGGHEFNTLLLAFLNADGIGRNLPDAPVMERIRRLRGPVDLRTFVSLSCTNCPDVAQALNIIALNNDEYTNTVIDGGQFPKEAEESHVQAVPTVYGGTEMISVGRASLSDLLTILEKKFGTDEAATPVTAVPRHFDAVIVGGGPAGAAAAIYCARKAMTVAVVANEPGGSVRLTGAIDNLITTQTTTGEQLAVELRKNMEYYGAEIFADRKVTSIDVAGATKAAVTAEGERFEAPILILTTGSSPRRLGVEGEEKYTGKGVAYCPHCDGPFFAGRDVAVVGGGNAGVEAAIDLAAICKHVTVIEFMERPVADEVLLDAMGKLDNVRMLTNTQVLRIDGDGTKATAIVVKDRATGRETTLAVGGVFVQIGTIPNSLLADGKLEMNKRGEVVTDREGRTSQSGVYAAGDVTDAPYKQIVTAIGEGANAALAAFNDRMRGNL